MDYSLLLGIHNLDKEPKAQHSDELNSHFNNPQLIKYAWIFRV